jgi:hypothetical protein
MHLGFGGQTLVWYKTEDSEGHTAGGFLLESRLADANAKHKSVL